MIREMELTGSQYELVNNIVKQVKEFLNKFYEEKLTKVECSVTTLGGKHLEHITYYEWSHKKFHWFDCTKDMVGHDLKLRTRDKLARHGIKRMTIWMNTMNEAKEISEASVYLPERKIVVRYGGKPWNSLSPLTNATKWAARVFVNSFKLLAGSH